MHVRRPAPGGALAGAVEDLLTPRSAGVGEALRADASGALGPMLNPSGMVLTKAYTIEAMYGFDVRSIGSNLHLSIVDSTTSKLAAGIYYDFIYASPKYGPTGVPGLDPASKPSITHTGSETGLALGVPLGSWFALGASLKYVRFTSDTPNPLYNAATNPNAPQTLTLQSTTSAAAADGFTLDVGLTLRLGDKFNLAVVGYNLIPLRAFDAPLALGMGLAVKPTPNLTIAFDDVLYFDKYHKLLDPILGTTQSQVTNRLGGGLEWLAGGKVPIRVGALWDQGRPGGYLTMGLGYVSTTFAIDLSYRQQITNGDDSRLVLGLRVFLGGAAPAL